VSDGVAEIGELVMIDSIDGDEIISLAEGVEHTDDARDEAD
jgi:hypothetical protein